VDDLRLLVVKFVSCLIKRIQGDSGFIDMMKAQGSLSIDLLQGLMRGLI